MTGPTEPIRYHALDSLRASMMLLGIILHAALPYTTLRLGLYKDASTNPVFDAIAACIHYFRMPVFFVMAGFFGALLYKRRGLGGLVKNRLKRILVPLTVAFIFLSPFIHAGAAFASAATKSGSLVGGLHAAQQTSAWDPGIYHLWFLSDLLDFYFLVLVITAAAGWFGAQLRERLSNVFRLIVKSPWRFVALAIPTFLALWPTPLIPIGRISIKTLVLMQVAPFLFFGFGWLLYMHSDLVSTFRRGAWWQIALAVPLLLVAFIATRQTLLVAPDQKIVPQLLAVGAQSLAVWLVVFGLTGLFLRYFDQARPNIRYMSDASYWMYLISLPLLQWIGGTLTITTLPAALKFLLTLCLAMPILLLSYHYCVRFTAIGAVLNGRKFPHHLP